MKVLTIQKREVNLEDYKKRSALDTDCPTIINEDVIVKDEQGNLILLYFHVPDDEIPNELVQALKRIKYDENIRTAGLKTRSAIFGYSPRIVLRKDYCSATMMARTNPKEHQIVCDFAEKMAEIYSKYLPEVFDYHSKLTLEKVSQDWRIGKSPFTSGIINKNNPLKYHFDTGNFNDVYSNMVVFKKDVAGGRLALPELGLTFELPNNSVFLFDGQKYLHGVTPIQYLTPEAYRYSIVYYSLKGMWHCQTIDEEIIRIRKLKFEREKKRLKNAGN